MHRAHRCHRTFGSPVSAILAAPTLAGCAKALMDETAVDFEGHVELFRRQADLAATVNDFLGQIDEPGAKAYMTCRAVEAAKIDFDATDDGHNADRGEAKRRAEQFFRIEASVGMD